MSWVTHLLGSLTIEQAKAIALFVNISDEGRQFPKMSLTGFEAIDIEWAGWDTKKLRGTHLRIAAVGGPEIVDQLIPWALVAAIMAELNSEISRNFDKPAESIFRRES